MDYSNRQLLASIRKVLTQLERLSQLVEQQTEAIREATRASIEINQSPPIVRPEIHVPPAVVHEVQRYDTQQNKREITKVRIDFWTLAVVIIYASFAGFTWFELNTQNIIQASANLSQSITSDRLFRETRSQTKAAQDSVEAIRTQMRQDQRPWIKAIGGVQQAIKAGEPVVGTVAFQNIGKTPAKDVVLEIIVEKVGVRQELAFNYSYVPRNTWTTGVMYPGREETDTGYWLQRSANNPSQAENRILTDVDVQELNAGKAYFIVYGRIRYVDGFKVDHITTFCAFLPFTRNFKVHAGRCTAYNGVDNN